MEQGAIDALDKFVPSRENMPDLQGNPLNRGLTSDDKAKGNDYLLRQLKSRNVLSFPV